MRDALADSGPLVALFDPRDAHHERCRAFLRDFKGRLITTWEVLTEALALLSVAQQKALLGWLEAGVKSRLLRVECTALDDVGLARSLIDKYRDLPMDFADASLYLVALRSGVEQIVTLDRRDFAAYRLPAKKRFVNLLDAPAREET
jgi:predicted nucleic acid-binding protein